MRLPICFATLLALLACKSLSQDSSLMPYTGKDGAVQEGEGQNLGPRKRPVQVRFPRPWRLWVDADSQIAKSAAELSQDKAEEARILSFLAEQPVASWYRGSISSVGRQLDKQVAGAREQDAFALMVLDNIPYRDCVTDKELAKAASQYKGWIETVARGIGDAKAIIVLEPEGITGLDCLDAKLRKERLKLLSEAVVELKKGENVLVYIAAGGPGILSIEEASSRLKSAGIAEADGSALNVAQYEKTDTVLLYGLSLRRKLGPKNFVIDTSRNGKGPPREAKPCNPTGVAVGELPIEKPDDEEIDSFLWLKGPGESDGPCGRDEPAAGHFFRTRALQLARAAGI